MMHNSGRDSGYSENASLDYCGISPSNFPLFSSKTDFSKSGIPEYSATEDKLKDSRITGSSCRALKHAVSNLTRLDDFVCEKIGNGFFSEVFKVKHRVTGNVMVLKMNLLRSNRANMLKEVQLMNQLCHPNILKFMGACVHEGQLHALTEYINGGSLEQLIQSKQELTYSVRMKLALDIAKGMYYLHSREIFHRDLTSKNVLIKKDEDCAEKMTAVVGDFGLAAKIPRPGRRLPTVGSPWWMSPECLKGQFYNETSDAFSYGIILCELIARIDADPDMLPRTSNFGLDYLAFVEICSQFPTPPPPDFLKLAFSCCNLESKNRPSFADVVKILETSLNMANNNRYILKSCNTLTEARSVESLPSPHPSAALNTTSTNSHRKLVHRRSLSEDMGLIMFPSPTAPSDKARCHILPLQSPPLKHVGESMCHEDPHYKPSLSKSNPFALLSQFKGVKKILASTNSTDLFSSCFELPSPFFGEDKKPSFYNTENSGSIGNDNISCSSGSLNDKVVATKITGNKKLPILYQLQKTSKLTSSSKDTGLEPLGAMLKPKSGINSSSIVIEPVVKPSEIKKSSSLLKLKTSSNSVVTKERCLDKECDLPYKSISKTPTFVINAKKHEGNNEFEYKSRSNMLHQSATASPTFAKPINSVSCSVINNEPMLQTSCNKNKPRSLPSSPTFSRRLSCTSNSKLPFKLDMDDTVQECGNSKALVSQPFRKISSLYAHPLYTATGYPNDIGHGLRSCSSSSNLSMLGDTTNLFFSITDTPVLSLKRRGSCESGFYSSVGDDFCITGTEACIGQYHYHTASSFTLSSSSAASSLFLDSTGDDMPTPLVVNSRFPFFVHHTASSTYTDSSEDISSLASNETPIWDERQRPRHISKIVEYFEKKQGNSSSSNSSVTNAHSKWEISDSSNRISTLHPQLRRNWLQADTHCRSSLDYYTRRKQFEKPLSTSSHVFPKRSINQRLIVCEGAVKSKLQLFDKRT